MWETVDFQGRSVVLSLAAWKHICDEHPELSTLRDAVIAVVREPMEHVSGRKPNEEWYFGQGFGPSRYVKVVVHYEEDAGQIWTAFPRRRFP